TFDCLRGRQPVNVVYERGACRIEDRPQAIEALTCMNVSIRGPGLERLASRPEELRNAQQPRFLNRQRMQPIVEVTPSKLRSSNSGDRNRPVRFVDLRVALYQVTVLQALRVAQLRPDLVLDSRERNHNVEPRFGEDLSIQTLRHMRLDRGPSHPIRAVRL